MKKAFFIGCNALGDTLCTTPAIRSFRRANPGTSIVCIVQNAAYCRVLDANPDLDLVIYNEHLWLHGMEGATPEWLHSLPLDIDEPCDVFRFDMNVVCAQEESFHDHIARGLAASVGIRIDSVRPVVHLTDAERRAARGFVRRPYVVFSRHSNANPRRPGGGGMKDWPDENWRRLARRLDRQGMDVISVGAETDARFSCPGVRDLHGLPIKVLAALIAEAACLVTLENGIAHLGAAVDAPMVELYSPIVPLAWAGPEPSARREVIYEPPERVGWERVADAVDRLSASGEGGIRGATSGCRTTAALPGSMPERAARP